MMDLLNFKFSMFQHLKIQSGVSDIVLYIAGITISFLDCINGGRSLTMQLHLHRMTSSAFLHILATWEQHLSGLALTYDQWSSLGMREE